MNRGGQMEIVRSVHVHRSVEDVFAYVSDFTKAKEWRTEVTESSMDPAGAMREETRLHEVAVVAGRRVFTESVIDVYEPPHRFTFAHVSGPIPVSGEFCVERAGDGSRLTYTLRLRLTGLWRVLLPILHRTGPKTVDVSLGRLAAHLAERDTRELPKTAVGPDVEARTCGWPSAG